MSRFGREHYGKDEIGPIDFGRVVKELLDWRTVRPVEWDIIFFIEEKYILERNVRIEIDSEIIYEQFGATENNLSEMMQSVQKMWNEYNYSSNISITISRLPNKSPYVCCKLIEVPDDNQ